MSEKLTIEHSSFLEFQQLYRDGKFGTQRLGQAFCNHFKLYKMADQSYEEKLWCKDERLALQEIQSLCDFTT